MHHYLLLAASEALLFEVKKEGLRQALSRIPTRLVSLRDGEVIELPQQGDPVGRLQGLRRLTNDIGAQVAYDVRCGAGWGCLLLAFLHGVVNTQACLQSTC